MVILVILLVLFLLGFFYNVVHNGYSNIAYYIVLIGILLTIIFTAINEQFQISNLKNWYLFKRKLSKINEWTYQNSLVNDESMFVQYNLTISFLIVTTTIKSRYFLVESNSNVKIATKIIFTIATLLLGWWALPQGPINTIKTIKSNISGDNRIPLKYIIFE